MNKATRRRFLTTLGLGSAGAAVAALAAGSDTSRQQTGQLPAEEKPQSKGYKVTEHVRKYYRTARV
jgi:hypothetical protein